MCIVDLKGWSLEMTWLTKRCHQDIPSRKESVSQDDLRVIWPLVDANYKVKYDPEIQENKWKITKKGTKARTIITIVPSNPNGSL